MTALGDSFLTIYVTVQVALLALAVAMPISNIHRTR